MTAVSVGLLYTTIPSAEGTNTTGVLSLEGVFFFDFAVEGTSSGGISFVSVKSCASLIFGEGKGDFASDKRPSEQAVNDRASIK